MCRPGKGWLRSSLCSLGGTARCCEAGRGDLKCPYFGQLRNVIENGVGGCCDFQQPSRECFTAEHRALSFLLPPWPEHDLPRTISGPRRERWRARACAPEVIRLAMRAILCFVASLLEIPSSHWESACLAACCGCSTQPLGEQHGAACGLTTYLGLILG